MDIYYFRGDYAFLSNFHPSIIDVDGISYPTVEHAYQASKTNDFYEKRRISALPTPKWAKDVGKQLVLPADWPERKVFVMHKLVHYKFRRHADLRAKLLATGDAIIAEHNNWGDTFWGVCNGQGQNKLGEILMAVRLILRRATASGSN